MPRLCDRPGCSAGAEIAFGFDAARQVAWFDDLRLAADGVSAGVLCRRHARSMVLPGGWVLDDRRQPMPQLFRTPDDADAGEAGARAGAADASSANAHRSAPPKRRAQRARAEQHTAEGEADSTETLAGALDPPESTPGPVPAEGADDTRGLPWVPVFDPADDLSGLLRPRGRLLTRAFLGDETSPLRRPSVTEDTDG